MPRRKSLTRRFLQHLLLISFARSVLTLVGRGRAWDEWDERKLVEPAQRRSFKRRFVQTASFSALFFAGLAISAGAGNGVRSLLDDGGTTPAVGGASGPSGPTGVTAVESDTPQKSVLSAEPAAQPAREAVAQAAPSRPVAAATTPSARTAVATAQPSHTTLLTGVPASQETKRTAIVSTHTARPVRTVRSRPHASHKRNTPKQHTTPKPAPPLDPEVHSFSASTVWLNRAAPDPTPPAARLKLLFARELVTYSRQAHVDWALVLATLRAEGNNGRSPAGSVALRSLALRLSTLSAHATPWAAALSYSSNASLADRVVALRHYYRAVGLPSLVHGLLSQKRDLQDRVLHDSRLHIYSGGRQDVAAGRVDARVLATMLYLAETFHEVTVSCLVSGHRLYARPGVVSAHIYGRAVDVAALNNVPIAGHQQPGGITEQAVRSVLMLPGGMLPAQVISLLGLGGPSFPLANHYDHIHIGF
jgi:hypothetical protein